jgi:RND family efflux transporter MFP subunit
LREKAMTKFDKRILALAGIVILGMIFGCGKSPSSAAKPQPPAKVENAMKEAELTTVKLSEKAEARLGIATRAVEAKSLPGTLVAGGEVVAVPGQEARVVAPAAGTVLAPAAGAAPRSGRVLRRGQEVMRLMLLPPDRDLIGVKEDLVLRQTQYDVAKSKADRARELLAVRAASRKDVEDAEIELARAAGALEAAKGRLTLFTGSAIDEAAAQLSTLSLTSPLDGVLAAVHVAPGQTVPAATALFEVARQDPLWVRVPVYVGDLAAIDENAEAVVRPFGGGPQPILIGAKPVQGPPLSDASSASADLYYEIGNRAGAFRIGQKLAVSLTKKEPDAGLAVPVAAVLYDISGGTWVYRRSAPQSYERVRVEVSHIVNGLAVVRRGVRAGDEVVVAGAAELFGTEFGVGK